MFRTDHLQPQGEGSSPPPALIEPQSPLLESSSTHSWAGWGSAARTGLQFGLGGLAALGLFFQASPIIASTDILFGGEGGPPPVTLVVPARSEPGPPISELSRAASARQAMEHPLSTESPRMLGQLITTPLSVFELAPMKGQWTGAPLVIHDNPETFSRPGVLGSTIAPVPGRGDGTYDLPGRAQVFALANNRSGASQRFSTIVVNTSSTAISLDISGTVYSKGVTPTDGKISPNYLANGGFRGPQAVAARSYLDAVPGKNGFERSSVQIAPGAAMVVSSSGMHPGGEIFSLLNLSARESGATFRVASVVSPAPLNKRDLERVRAGTYPAAGIARDFAVAGANRLGRPNGVVEAGSTFEGGRTIVLTPGTRTGDLFYATRLKNAGSTAEIGGLSRSLPNPPGVGPQATTSDANFGTRHKLSYVLDNRTAQARDVEVALTAPSAGEGAHRPLGGELTLPLRVNGTVVNVRVDGRGEGRVVWKGQVPPGAKTTLTLELAHFGNTFAPAAFEFRVR